MKRRRKICIALVIAFFVLAWRAWPMIGIFTRSNLEVSDDFRLLERVAPPRTKTVMSYGGFSHPGFDPVRLSFEILLKPRRIFHGHAFSHSSVENSSVSKIAAVLSDRSSFQEWAGNKACGGFHADRYFRWTEDTQTWEVLLCMGCHEALLFHGGQSLRCDISRGAARAIEAIENEEG